MSQYLTKKEESFKKHLVCVCGGGGDVYRKYGDGKMEYRKLLVKEGGKLPPAETEAPREQGLFLFDSLLFSGT